MLGGMSDEQLQTLSRSMGHEVTRDQIASGRSNMEQMAKMQAGECKMCSQGAIRVGVGTYPTGSRTTNVNEISEGLGCDGVLSMEEVGAADQGG